jgi:DNA-binding NarL/FixJ family response regulator
MHNTQRKSVLILEDEHTLRHKLGDRMRDGGFQVSLAASSSEAREKAAQIEGGPDVCVLDMSLESDKATGADVGQEIRRCFPDHPPEFLIYSAHQVADYFKQAIDLDAANYLPKEPRNIAAVVRHVRVLAVCRALAGERPGLLAEIDQIASRSQGQAEALMSFLQEIVRPELETSLGAPFLILYSEAGETRSVAGAHGLPAESAAYAAIQGQLDIQADPSEPLTLDNRVIAAASSVEDRAAAEVLARLLNASFVPLARLGKIRISLGVIQALKSENALQLARLLAKHLPATLTRLLLALTREIRRRQRAVLETTSRFCLYVGQEQVSLVDRAVEEGAFDAGGLVPGMVPLRRLGEELRAAGELLGEVAMPPAGRRPEDRQAVAMSGLLHDVWEDLLIDFPGLQRELLEVQGDCSVLGRPGTLYVAMSRILQWLANRNSELAPDGRPPIQVTCDPRQSKILIQDASERLAPEARRRLFSLYSPPTEEEFKKLGRRGEFLGLYLSKVLIEIENGGNLEDVTESSGRETGHHFSIRFPSAGGEPSGRDAAGGAHA